MSQLTKIGAAVALVCLSYGAALTAQTLAPTEGFPFSLTVTRTEPGNLLANPGFEVLQEGGTAPAGWAFGNFGGTPDMSSGVSQDAHRGVRSAMVASTSNFPGYWLQTVNVEEGVRYYASVYLKATMTAGSLGLRLATEQYKDDGPGVSWATNNSNTDVRSYAECGQGEGLEDFIDPANLRVIRRREWNLYQLEFVVPAGRKVDCYAYWAGLYGVGTCIVDDAYFGKAAFELSGTVAGPALKRLRIVEPSGKACLDLPLKAGETEHSFQVKIESRLPRCQVEVTDGNGTVWRRAL